MEEVTTIKVGDRIPSLEMDAYFPDRDELGKINLSGIIQEGKWLVLFFYPADYTFVCPTELADVGRIYPQLKELGVEVVSVSTDTHFVHYAWKRTEKLLADISFPMAADPTHKISRIFGVLDENTGLALRGTFVIDPDGTLVASEINYYPVGRNAEELLRKIRAFQHVRNNPQQVCPARWEPGKKTLTPGKEIVGKVGEELEGS